MNKFLFPLFIMAAATGVNANIDPKITEICLKAVDFQGCVKAMTGQGDGIKKQNELLNEIKKLPSRISNTSLRDLSGGDIGGSTVFFGGSPLSFLFLAKAACLMTSNILCLPPPGLLSPTMLLTKASS